MKERLNPFPLLVYIIAFSIFNAVTAGIAYLLLWLFKASNNVDFIVLLLANYIPVWMYLAFGFAGIREVSYENIQKVIGALSFATVLIVAAISTYFINKVLLLHEYTVQNYVMPCILNGLTASIYFFIVDEKLVPNYL